MKAMPFRLLAVAFALSCASVATLAQVASSNAQRPAPATQEDEFLKGVLMSDTQGIVAPVVLQHVYPKYTSDAMRAKIQGTVEVQAVVAVDGSVARTRIVASLDKTYGLDLAALAAAGQWRFKPATLGVGGPAVPVAVTLNLEFRLH